MWARKTVQKFKNFAQRELELQRLKKERENHKAKFVQEVGGLKNTTIAMANQSWLARVCLK